MKMLSNHILKKFFLSSLFLLFLTYNQSMATEALTIDDELLNQSSRSYVDFSKINCEELVAYVKNNKTITDEQMETEIIPNVIFGLVDYGKYEAAGKILKFHIDKTQGNIDQNLKDFLSEYSIKWNVDDSEGLLIKRIEKKLK